MACISHNFGASIKIGQLPVASQKQFPNKFSQLFFLQTKNFRSSKYCDSKNLDHLNRYQSFTSIFNSVSSDNAISGEKQTHSYNMPIVFVECLFFGIGLHFGFLHNKKTGTSV